MTKPEISGIAPFFIVRSVPAALAFYRDRLGFDITFQGPEPDDIFFGIVSGVLVHTIAAAYGLAAILATSAQAYVVIKFAGAAYLAYLGIRMMLSGPVAGGAVSTFERDSDWSIYRAGLLSNVLNPKVALFFLAFLPQFVAPNAESRVLAFLFLGAVFTFNGTLWCLFLVWAASAIKERLRGTASSGLILKRAVGVMFVGLGVRLAVSK